jgi:hypothetical protein
MNNADTGGDGGKGDVCDNCPAMNAGRAAGSDADPFGDADPCSGDPLAT